jgi:hypothetical protein
MWKAEPWDWRLGLGLWSGVAVVGAELLVLASQPAGLYTQVADGMARLQAFIGPVWPLELVSGFLILACLLALTADRAGLLALDQPAVALELLGEAGQWGRCSPASLAPSWAS